MFGVLLLSLIIGLSTFVVQTAHTNSIQAQQERIGLVRLLALKGKLEKAILSTQAAHSSFLLTRESQEKKRFHDYSIEVPNLIFQLSFLPLASDTQKSLTELSALWSGYSIELNRSIIKATQLASNPSAAEVNVLLELASAVNREFDTMEATLEKKLTTADNNVQKFSNHTFTLTLTSSITISLIFLILTYQLFVKVRQEIRRLLSLLENSSSSTPQSDCENKPLTEPALEKIRLAILKFRRSEQLAAIEKIELSKQHANEQEEFSSVLAHEIRTPLTTMTGLVQSECKKSCPSRSVQNQLIKTGNGLSQLVTDALDYQALKNGKCGLKPEIICVDAIIQNLINTTKTECLTKGLDFTFQDTCKIKSTVNADKQKLLRAIEIVISNALKFTPKPGSIHIKTFIEKRTEGDQWCITVKDTGVGISKEHLSTAFQPFKQCEHGSTRGWEGTGLGLALAKEIMFNQNGNIKIDSERMRWTTVTLSLPVQTVQDGAADTTPPVDSLTLLNKKVLLVEDHLLNAKINSNLLKSEFGCSIQIVNSGEEALEELRHNQHYDLIFMDINLGNGIDGVQTSAAIKKAMGEHCPPIIALSAGLTQAVVNDCIKVGMKGTLTKPFNRESATKILAALFPEGRKLVPGY